MAVIEELDEAIQETEHKAAYIYNPDEDELDGSSRPSKRRKVSKKQDRTAFNGVPDSKSGRYADGPRHFPPLLDGAEDEVLVRIRQDLFEQPWGLIEDRIKKVLRDANHKTLDEVAGYLQTAAEEIPSNKIPTAFIITGASIASQDLLFEQLSETLQTQAESLVVRLRSSDVSNLRSTLTKIIQSATSKGAPDDEDQELTTSRDGRKFLKYDLEALHVQLRNHERRNVVIVFQDSEGFDGGLLSDLIMLFHSWLDRIPFALVFGVATSVELLQARLLKSTCRYLHGAQFDVEQSASIVNRIFKTAICHADLPLRFGPSTTQALLDRQRDQVAGMSVFVESLKYLHMCHYYANPLSFLLQEDVNTGLLKQEHFDMLRSLSSFRHIVETAVGNGDSTHAKKLLVDDSYLSSFVAETMHSLRAWRIKLLRTVKILEHIQDGEHGFTELYLDALSQGSRPDAKDSTSLGSIERLDPGQAIDLSNRLLRVIQEGDEALGLEGWAGDEQSMVQLLESASLGIQGLQSRAQANGHALRSKHSSQAKVLRTTVVAQKVQLSHDTATLTDEDNEYTELLRRLNTELSALVHIDAAEDLPFHEIWLYDTKSPHKDVFVPRPRTVIERALSQPHDYLGCSCCKSGDGQLAPSLPATAIVYQLYLETGSLINVADLWSAYLAIVGEDNEGGLDERTALVLFYRALAELKTMGFVKQTRKKADHIAKLAWKGL
ncbi:origin recognition complex subunit [Microdochium trichocladiopsis]|uniref:Origin recognition complex subunit n=1 Tax=Microdochium trichocladiopsis TaxID=1682393 RepID=A0A9P8YB56_9PEZI|nr:origin recognition complex subunit [Microdochium trichocladiopsis]KAH7035047.1 origin recognition complex subunit [Microdochium trichocladiopsis]